MDGYFERGDTQANVSAVLATFLRINVTGQATGKLSIFAGASGSPVIPPAKAFSILDHEENATNTPRSKSRNAHTPATTPCVYTKMRCNWTRHENGGRVDIANSTVDRPFEENSFRKRTNHADQPNTTGHACTRARGEGLSIFGKLSAFPFDCSLPVTDTANCRGPPTIDIRNTISTASFTNSPSFLLLFFFLSFLSPARLLHD